VTDFGIDIFVSAAVSEGVENGASIERPLQTGLSPSCGETAGERTQSSMRPNCRQIDACEAKKPDRHCLRCAMAAVRANPEYEARRRATVRARIASDQSHAERLRNVGRRALNEWRARPETKAQQRENAMEQLGKLNSPEALARRREIVREQRIGWCPVARREEYLMLARKMPAAEAKRIILDDIRTEAIRGINAISRAQRERHARQKQQEY
jgi:hypothetical protein